MGDIYSIVYGAVGGGVTGVIAAILGGIAVAYFKRIMAERDKLAEARITSMQNEIKEQKTRLEQHIKEDNPVAVAVSLKNLTD